ncbi:AAA family ATPase [Pararhodobacter zhoushanensis]|uniref:AAA family ATPase n=1 Tax=Pararhodobacter zhoushanensis TaxID=2479545 RepID=A0ABT3GX62_9RHOB|nr:AAA family ATPase [Pararhodobacter zhoushanensis]MCW1932149.1 AAA family ATPase [Pararhodobacter zhoushanensis]
MRRFFLLTGCSGSGKSTLLDALAAEGMATVPEPGRRLVAQALAGDGKGLPWDDPKGFAERAIALALDDWHAAQALRGPVVFDRGLLDAIAAYEHVTGALPPQAQTLGACYNPQVFVAQPWPAIFATDAERQHDFDAALAEYHRLIAFLPRFGYRALPLPEAPVADRVTFVRAVLAQQNPPGVPAG